MFELFVRRELIGALGFLHLPLKLHYCTALHCTALRCTALAV